MSHNNTERRELTAAELDQVGGGLYDAFLIVNFMAPRNGDTGSAGTGNDTVSTMFDI